MASAVASAPQLDLASIDVPQLEALVAQFYGAGTAEQVRGAGGGRADARVRTRAHDARAAPRLPRLPRPRPRPRRARPPPAAPGLQRAVAHPCAGRAPRPWRAPRPAAARPPPPPPAPPATATAPAQRAAAEKALKAYQDHPDAWSRVDSILEKAATQQTKFFALQARAARRLRARRRAARRLRARPPRCTAFARAPRAAQRFARARRRPAGRARRGAQGGRRRAAGAAAAAAAAAPPHSEALGLRPPPLPPPPCPPPQILESVIKFRWGALPLDQREGVKNYVSNLIIKYATSEALFRWGGACLRVRVHVRVCVCVCVCVRACAWRGAGARRRGAGVPPLCPNLCPTAPPPPPAPPPPRPPQV